ncbi:MAG: hypothetical protein ABIA77_02630 [Candidatus Omnitrophota bacterium]
MKNVISLGAQIKSGFSVISPDGLYSLAPGGDLEDIENYNGFETAVRGYLRDNGITPDIIACDMHPDYRSTYLAEDLSREYKGADLVRVQHHFAHIAACMLDNDIDGEVIGVSFDGTGYGDDGKSWGGEFMLATRSGYRRRYHLDYVPQPGGDAASREGWRMAAAYLAKAYGDGFMEAFAPFTERVGGEKIAAVKEMMEKEINCPLTSSMGRLFDAVASLTGLCDVSEFEAEGAILLEKTADDNTKGYYDIDIAGSRVSVYPMIKQIVEDMKSGTASGVISARFHNTIGEMICRVSGLIREETGVDTVLLSGGCFQNKYLLRYAEDRFRASGLKLYSHKKYSPTDLGISVGQAVIAATIEDQT